LNSSKFSSGSRGAPPARIVAPTKAAIARAAAMLRAGDLVAFPTETVYGLGADATNRDAVRRIFAAKGRPSEHPVIVHLAGASWRRLSGPARSR
jgi:L-threonylcarbamoyladenylate synthase